MLSRLPHSTSIPSRLSHFAHFSSSLDLFLRYKSSSLRLPLLFASQVLLERVPLNGTVWLSFGGANVMEMMLNWAYHVLHLGMGDRMLIGAFDETVLRELYVRYTILSL